MDDGNNLLGILTVSDILGESSLEASETLKACDLLKVDPIIAYPEETCREAAERMATLGVGRLPVMSRENPKKIVGIITRSDLLKPRLLHADEEKKVQRVSISRQVHRDIH